MKKLKKKILPVVLAVLLCISVLPVPAVTAAEKSLVQGSIAETVFSSGDVITIENGYEGEIKIPHGTNSITLKSESALSGVYITSESAVELIIDGLDITAPDYRAAIDLADGSTLTVKGENFVQGGVEGAGVRVEEGKSITINGDGILNAAGESRIFNPAGAATIGGNGSPDEENEQPAGENSGDITITGDVTIIAKDDFFSESAVIGAGGGAEKSSRITISGNAVIESGDDALFGSSGEDTGTGNIVIDGGSLKASRLQTAPENADGAPLNRVDIPVGGKATVKVTGENNYTYSANTQEDGSAYLWLPVGGDYIIHVHRETQTEAYLVTELPAYSYDAQTESISSNVSLAQPYAAYSNNLAVISVTPTGVNRSLSGEVAITFDTVPTVTGTVKLKTGNTEIPLTIKSGAGTKVYTYAYNGLAENTAYSIVIAGFTDGTDEALQTGNYTFTTASSTTAYISPDTASFDLYSGHINHKDIQVTLTTNGFSLNRITYGTTALTLDTDYTKSGDVYTIKKEYFEDFVPGSYTIVFEMNNGSNPSLVITLTDSTSKKVEGVFSGGNVYVLKSNTNLIYTVKKDYNLFDYITINGEILPKDNYQVTATTDGLSVTLLSTYLDTLKEDIYNMEVVFTDGIVCKEEVEVSATAKTFTITAVSGGNGSISPSGSIAVAKGDSKTFTFTPNSGYVISQVTVDGTAVTVTDGKYTITDVQADMTINVTFTASGSSTNNNNNNSATKTGDTSNIILWVIVSAFSLVLLLSFAVNTIRKRKSNK